MLRKISLGRNPEKAGRIRVRSRFQYWLVSNSNLFPDERHNYVGCISYKLSDQIGGLGDLPSPGISRIFHFMDNWISVFNCFVIRDEIDEFGMKAELFQSAVDFYLSDFVMTLIILLSLYLEILVVYQVIHEGFTQVITPYPGYIFVNPLMVLFCLWGRVIYKKQLFGEPPLTNSHGLEMKVSKNILKRTSKFFADWLNSSFSSRFVQVGKKRFHESELTNSDFSVSIVTEEGVAMSVNPMSTKTLHDMQHVKSNPLLNLNPSLEKYLENHSLAEQSGYYTVLNVATKYLLYMSPEDYFRNRNMTSFSFQERTSSFLRLSLAFVFLGTVGYCCFLVYHREYGRASPLFFFFTGAYFLVALQSKYHGTLYR